MLYEEVMEPANRNSASSIILAPIKNGPFKFCTDCRNRDTLIVKDSYHLSRMIKCINYLQEARIFSTLDVPSRYW